MGEWRFASGAYVRRVERDGAVIAARVADGVLGWYFTVIESSPDDKTRELLEYDQVGDATQGMARADAWLMEVRGE